MAGPRIGLFDPPGWIADGLVPEFDRYLRSDHRRAVVIAVVEDLEKVTAMGFLQRSDEPLAGRDDVEVVELALRRRLAAHGP